MYDYEASIQRLIEQIVIMKSSSWSPTPEVAALRGMASRLIALADELDVARWMRLESAVDALLLEEVRVDGCHIHSPKDRKGFFKGTLWRMREIADLAQRQADAYPDPRARIELPFAAMALLHILYHCDKERPTKYDSGDGVAELDRVCRSAGIVKSAGTLRNALSDAIDNFDPFFDWTAALDNFIVYKQ